ncbi:hypothetical protein KAS14_04795 [Candidatus Bathyarchaeota archaeon]|nr:hypothetical protein [Candidatus Bathyarchaeota archaeon]
MSLNRMIEKARRLLKTGRADRIGMDVFSVIGDHGTYTVAQNHACIQLPRI